MAREALSCYATSFVSHCRSSLTSKPFPCSLISLLNTHIPSSILMLPNPGTLLPSFPLFIALRLLYMPQGLLTLSFPSLLHLSLPVYTLRICPLSIYHSVSLPCSCSISCILPVSKCNLQKLLSILGQHTLNKVPYGNSYCSYCILTQ